MKHRYFGEEYFERLKNDNLAKCWKRRLNEFFLGGIDSIIG
jgi:hypothetical protein